MKAMAGKAVTVEVLGYGGRIEFFATVHGIVNGVRNGRLYLDSQRVEQGRYEDLASMFVPQVRSEDGIDLEHIRAIYGPRHARIWP
ncbi:MAG: hypothetical protein JOZ68_11320 [Acidimicrobiia bacterium]|nr:hypothetical protein [Acidimicrobiia bacterium]MBV9041590.1 hypothetical protein [Acidimicrobiia bacterium]